MLPKNYEIVFATPEPEIYRNLRVAAGMSPKSTEAAVLGLPNTLFGVMIRHEGQVVGMGRVIGDGGLFFQVVDIAVEPAHQGRGLGKAIVGTIMEHLRATLKPGAYVSLIADGDAKHLYAKFGFKATAPASIGMSFTA